MNRILSLVTLLFLGACAGPPETLSVKQFLLRDQVRDEGEEPMVRMEKSRRLHGAISMEQRRQRLGQYYTIHWHDPAGAGQGPVEVVFEYQQAATGALIKRSYQRFGAGTVSGQADFQVTGEDFRKNGRVLAWQVVLRRDGREVASRKSYLWR